MTLFKSLSHLQIGLNPDAELLGVAFRIIGLPLIDPGEFSRAYFEFKRNNWFNNDSVMLSWLRLRQTVSPNKPG